MRRIAAQLLPAKTGPPKSSPDRRIRAVKGITNQVRVSGCGEPHAHEIAAVGRRWRFQTGRFPALPSAYPAEVKVKRLFSPRVADLAVLTTATYSKFGQAPGCILMSVILGSRSSPLESIGPPPTRGSPCSQTAT